MDEIKRHNFALYTEIVKRLMKTCNVHNSVSTEIELIESNQRGIARKFIYAAKYLFEDVHNTSRSGAKTRQ